MTALFREQDVFLDGLQLTSTIRGCTNGRRQSECCVFFSVCTLLFFEVSNFVWTRQIQRADHPGAAAMAKDRDKGPTTVRKSQDPTLARSPWPQGAAIKTVCFIFDAHIALI